MMNTRRTTAWPRAVAIAILAAGPAMAQSAGTDSVSVDVGPTPEAAAPAGPHNPYSPPPCTGTVFTDVTCTTAFDPWVEQFAADSITGGCGAGMYCPDSSVTRAQMAVFVEKAMRGTAIWSPGDRGNFNTGLGGSALRFNTTAVANTAVGEGALLTQSFENGGNLWFTNNTAVGASALYYNEPTSTSNGRDNTAAGANALYANTTGFSNTALGFDSGNRNGDVVSGYAGSPVTLHANQTGSFNTFVGSAGATATDLIYCTAIGMDAYCDANAQVRLGNFFVNSIGGKVAWSALSDARAKSDIRDLDLGLSFVLALRPVSYRYRGGNGRTDMGFVAQDVEAVLGDGYNVIDAGGDPDRTLSMRYTELIAPLVRATQEQQVLIEAQKREIERQSRRIEMLEARLAGVDALRAQVESLIGVSASATSVTVP